MKMRLLFAMALAAILLFWSGLASAYTMQVIGTATYNNTVYNLIWDPDNNGNSLVWLDYSMSATNWSNQKNWAAGLGANLNINLAPGYSVVWDSGWRLPHAGGTGGMNQTASEMGHLFYSELGNYAFSRDPVTGDVVSANYRDFMNLRNGWYWFGTESTDDINYAWQFHMRGGHYSEQRKSVSNYGLAVRSGQVSAPAPAPVPEPGTMALMGLGLAGLALARRFRRK